MNVKEKLIIIKLVHTLIWLFYAFIIFYILYAAIANRIDIRFWIAVAFVAIEGIVLIINSWRCPLTVVAKEYSKDVSIGFDIFIPRWFAKYNITIFTIIFAVAMIIAIYRIIF